MGGEGGEGCEEGEGSWSLDYKKNAENFHKMGGLMWNSLTDSWMI